MTALTRAVSADRTAFWSAEPVSKETEALYDRVSRFVTPVEWAVHAPVIDRIQALKQDKNAVILAHNYQTPEIYNTVADITGDSLALARAAVSVEADIIVMAGVHFMAETTKLLNPSRTVLMPDMRAGCSLAESITAADIRLLREKYPGVPVVSYVNTSAEVKAESDVCVTSSNAIKVVEALGVPRVISLPDRYLSSYIRSQTDIEVIAWEGACEVHERFTADEIRAFRDAHPGLVVLAHPECPPDVLEEADFVGSTAGMSSYVADHQPRQVALITECSMSDNVSAANPEVEFVRPCNLCPHMKRITLNNIETALRDEQTAIEIDPGIAARAVRAVERMLELSA